MANLNLNDAQIENILAEVKRSGLFDQFRKECIADVDTKPAYQNLKFKVENTVSSFLAKQKWNPETNRIQLREQLRKYVIESSYIDSGIERIVEQVLSPRMPNFQTQVEELMCRYLNIERPKRKPEVLEEVKDETSLLPTDLEAVSSPESNSKVLEEGGEENDEDFESPAFEPLEGFETSVKKEDPDTRLSGLSALSSNEDLPKVEVKAEEAQESQLSVVSSCSRLSIVMPASEKDTSSPKPPEVFNITEEAQMPKFSENSNSVDCKPVKEELAYETPVFDFKKEEIEFQGTDRKSLTLDEKLKEEILESETKRNVHLEDDHDSVSHSSETKLEIVEPETSKPESAIEAKKEESEKKTESEDKKEDTEDKKEEKKVDKPREKSSSSSSNRHHRSSHKSDRDRHRRDRSRDRRRDDSGSKKSSSYSSRSDKHKKHDRQRSRSRSRDRRHDHRKDDKSRDRSRDHKRDKERKSSEHRKSLPSSHKDKDVPRKEKEPKAEPEIPSGSPLPSTSKAEVDVKAVEKEEVKPEEVPEPAPEKLPFQDLGTEPLSDDELVIDEKTVHSEEEFLGFTEEEIGAQKPAVAEKKDQKKDIILNKSLLEEDSFLGFDIKKETKAQETNAQETKTQESNTNTPETAGSSKRARKPNNRYLSEEFDVTQAEDEPAEKKRKRSADVRKTGERKSKRGASEDSTCDDESKSSKGSSKGRR